MSDIGIIVLAAGASTRMGQPKQLLKINEETLIRHVLGIAMSSGCSPVVVVLGKYAELLADEIADFQLEITVNEDWEQGMGTSLKKGVEKMLELDPGTKAAIILLVDQPFVDTSILKNLKQEYLQSNHKVIASKYGETIGVPALFDASVFPQLLELEGKSGAKKVIQSYGDRQGLAFIDFPDGRFDLDTPEDYERLKRRSAQKRRF